MPIEFQIKVTHFPFYILSELKGGLKATKQKLEKSNSVAKEVHAIFQNCTRLSVPGKQLYYSLPFHHYIYVHAVSFVKISGLDTNSTIQENNNFTNGRYYNLCLLFICADWFYMVA